MKCILRPRDYGKDNYCPDKFLQENEAIYKTMMGETKYQETIVQLMNKMPGMGSTQEPELIDLTLDNNNKDGDSEDSDLDMYKLQLGFIFGFLYLDLKLNGELKANQIKQRSIKLIRNWTQSPKCMEMFQQQ